MNFAELSRLIAHLPPWRSSKIVVAFEDRGAAYVHRRVEELSGRRSPWGINTAIDEKLITKKQAVQILDELRALPFDIESVR